MFTRYIDAQEYAQCPGSQRLLIMTHTGAISFSYLLLVRSEYRLVERGGHFCSISRIADSTRES